MFYRTSPFLYGILVFCDLKELVGCLDLISITQQPIVHHEYCLNQHVGTGAMKLLPSITPRQNRFSIVSSRPADFTTVTRGDTSPELAKLEVSTIFPDRITY